jgi:hypothetical protein
MKVEIDLNEILGDEYGSETLNESIRRQVIEKASKITVDHISKRIDQEISTIITAQIKQVTESKMEPIILAALDGEYIIVDRYGDRNGKATTLRKEMIRNFQEQMVYKKTNYDSEKNQFSRNVDEMVNGALSSFKKEFNETVTKEFNKEAINSAVNKISEMLKLPAAIK